MPYHPPDAYDIALRQTVDASDGLAKLDEIGRSVRGRPIHAVTVSRRPEARAPVAFVYANMHGVEVITAELALRVLRDLCAPTELGDELLSVADVVIVPVGNPDGRAAAFESLDRPGPIALAPRRNANGVDLNRNWPPPEGAKDSWLPIAGTGIRWLPWYRGRAPLSEPEVRAVHDLFHRVLPFAVLNLHSTGEILTYPWSSKPEPPADEAGFHAMIDAFRGHQKRAPYRFKQSRAWYPILGSSNDHFYGSGALPLTVELARPGAGVRTDASRAGRFFWYANPVDPDPHIDDVADACTAALLAARRYTRHQGSGPA